MIYGDILTDYGERVCDNNITKHRLYYFTSRCCTAYSRRIFIM